MEIRLLRRRGMNANLYLYTSHTPAVRPANTLQPRPTTNATLGIGALDSDHRCLTVHAAVNSSNDGAVRRCAAQAMLLRLHCRVHKSHVIDGSGTDVGSIQALPEILCCM